jgi:hypothetical protein
MNEWYDMYKEEALRILYTPKAVYDNCWRSINALKSDLVPGVKVVMNENHYEEYRRMAITVAGHVNVVDNQAWYGRQLDIRTRLQNRWLVRKLKDFGQTIGASPIRVSTCNGTVYFSYHVHVEHVSHLVDS